MVLPQQKMCEGVNATRRSILRDHSSPTRLQFCKRLALRRRASVSRDSPSGNFKKRAAACWPAVKLRQPQRLPESLNSRTPPIAANLAATGPEVDQDPPKFIHRFSMVKLIGAAGSWRPLRNGATTAPAKKQRTTPFQRNSRFETNTSRAATSIATMQEGSAVSAFGAWTLASAVPGTPW